MRHYRHNNQFKRVCNTIFVVLLCAGCATTRPKAPSLSPEDIAIQRKVDLLFLEANVLKNNGQSDAAFDLFQHILAYDSLHAATNYEIANLLLEINSIPTAFAHLKRASQIEPTNYYYNTLYAQVARHIRQLQEAADIYRRLIPIYPDKPELKLMLADILSIQEKYGEAIEVLQELENSIGIIDDIIYKKFKLYKALGNIDTGFEELMKLRQSTSNYSNHALMMGNIYLEENRDAQALQQFNEALDLDPDNGYAKISLASYYIKQNDSIMAQKMFEEALLSNKIDIEEKNELIPDFLSLAGKSPSMIQHATKTIQEMTMRYPQNEITRKLFAEFLLSTQQSELATEQYTLLLQQNPSEVTYYTSLMGLAIREKEYMKAIEWGEKAIINSPENISLYRYTANLLIVEKEYNKAIVLLNLALKQTKPDDIGNLTDLHGLLGDAYHEIGEKEKSYAAYESSLNYFPKNIAVLNNYSYFLTLDNKDLSKAERMVGEAIKLEPNNPTYLDTYAWVFYMQGNYVLAKFYIESALNKAGADQNIELLDHYGDILLRNEEVEMAVDQWKRALLLDPKRNDIKKKIDKYTPQ